MKNPIIIKQKKYGRLEVENCEKDIVEIWMQEKNNSEVIHVERKNIPLLIDALKQCNKGQVKETRN